MKYTLEPILRKKNPIKVGDMLLLGTGGRSKGPVRKLGAAVCTGVDYVELLADEVFVVGNNGAFGCGLDKDWLDEFAKCDGFANWIEMWGWFKKHHKIPDRGSFKGNIIQWGALEKP